MKDAAAQGYPAAQYFQGNVAFHAGDHADAAQWYQSAVSQNLATAQVALALMHLRAQGGLEQNEAKAVALLQLAAASGSDEAAVMLKDRMPRFRLPTSDEILAAVMLLGIAAVLNPGEDTSSGSNTDPEPYPYPELSCGIGTVEGPYGCVLDPDF